MPIVTRHEYDPVDHIDQYVLACLGNPLGPYLVDMGSNPKGVRLFGLNDKVRPARKFSLAADAMAFIDEHMPDLSRVLPVRVRTPVTATPAEMLD